MSFSLLILIFFLVWITLASYRSIYSTALGVVFLFGLTSIFYIYGMNSYTAGNPLFILNGIEEKGFRHLIAGLFVLDALCSIKIIRTYIFYRKVNSTVKQEEA